MSREDMIKMLEEIRDHTNYVDNSIQQVINELGRLWIIEDNASGEDAIREGWVTWKHIEL